MVPEVHHPGARAAVPESDLVVSGILVVLQGADVGQRDLVEVDPVHVALHDLQLLDLGILDELRVDLVDVRELVALGVHRVVVGVALPHLAQGGLVGRDHPRVERRALGVRPYVDLLIELLIVRIVGVVFGVELLGVVRRYDPAWPDARISPHGQPLECQRSGRIVLELESVIIDLDELHQGARG